MQSITTDDLISEIVVRLTDQVAAQSDSFTLTLDRPRVKQLFILLEEYSKLKEVEEVRKAAGRASGHLGGRPRGPRCACGEMTPGRAKQRNHVCFAPKKRKAKPETATIQTEGT